ncbi:MAG: restriction endonuclease [Alphaproteobacteria bacterium]|uniref:restriction endonuclease n=1 Tax=Brevundimonas sp. TaxID=1871086 RepID=UPI0035632882|nr:restriction endonuclease [Alphaproteobacteria bacterium]
MIKDDEYLERLVAGIHTITGDAADVRWNEIINGRQFDVVVRFQMGTLRYLVLIEVKNRKRPASASDLDAFVSKAGDQRANKAVFVTAAGFQEGAKTVALRHGVDLFTISFDLDELTIPAAAGAMVMRRNPDAPADAETQLGIGAPRIVASVPSFVVVYETGARATLPSEPTQMNYYMDRTRVGDGRSLMEVVQGQPITTLNEGERLQRSETFRPATALVPPDDYFFPHGQAKALEWTIVGTVSRMITGNLKIDPSLFAGRVCYTNVLTGDVSRFGFDELPLGTRNVKPGSFYFSYHPLMYYRCDAVNGEIVTWTLVESFQAGELIRARFTQDIVYASHYIPVTDRAIQARLERRFADYEALVARGEG